MEKYSEKVRIDDILMFINACLAVTGQSEFYENEVFQHVTIEFLHEYFLTNYRNLYAEFLTTKINDFNKALIIFNLLSTGKTTNQAFKDSENKLIEKGLNSLSKPRIFKLFEKLRKKRINNRRTRAVIKKYFTAKDDLSFEAVKYRAKFRSGVIHSHLKITKETADFLFGGWKKNIHYKNELFQSFKKAHYSKEALYELPFTIAEGLASKWEIKKEIFLEKIIPKMTFMEKYRMQNRYKFLKINGLEIDYARIPVTKNALYILSLPEEEKIAKVDYLENIMNQSAQNFINKNNFKPENVIAILDNSYSSSGSTEKKRRPLAIAMATHYILKNCCENYQAFWTHENLDSKIFLKPKGSTNIADLVLKAITLDPKIIIIISDGYENHPFNGTREIIRVFSQKLFKPIKFIHLNPVFSADDYMPKLLSDLIPTFNIREAEDLSFLINFADYAENKTSLTELENYLNQEVNKLK